VDNRSVNEKPERGTHVDSISYYTYDLADRNKQMHFMQQRKTEIALTGNSSSEADNWLATLMISAYEVADQIMVDSAEDNALRATYASFDEYGTSIPQAELMSSQYGSFGARVGLSPRSAQGRPYSQSLERYEPPLTEPGLVPDAKQPPLSTDDENPPTTPPKTPSEAKLLVSRTGTEGRSSLLPSA
jgi:hypothetical protein